MRPLRSRIIPILGLMLGAPVCAEYLQAYLPETGDAARMLGGLVVLGPLYGGAALLIRELAVRTARGWPGVLLLAAAFGLLMTGAVDRSMWLEHDPDIAYWDDLRAGTLLPGLGFAAFPVLSWVTGHVVFSIAAPLALTDALAPGHRGRPLLGRWGLCLVTALCVTAALLIRFDPEYDSAQATAVRTAVVLVVALALAVLALSRLGLPLSPPATASDLEGRRRSPAVVLTAGLIGILALDLMPFTWWGAAGYAAILTLGLALLARVARRATWNAAQVTALALAAVIERTLLGFLAPLPPGVSLPAKLVQGAVLLLAVAAVAAIAWNRACRPVALSSRRMEARGRPG